jgi:hypothetical protein
MAVLARFAARTGENIGGGEKVAENREKSVKMASKRCILYAVSIFLLPLPQNHSTHTAMNRERSQNHEGPERRIPEAEYAADLAEGLNELSGAILRSGLSISAIARGTRCHWETVYHAANGVPVRFDSARRIMYYLKTIGQ